MATWSSLADGQLPSSKGTLFTAVDMAAVTALLLTNTDSGDLTFNIYILRADSGSVSRRIAGKDVTLAAGESVNICDHAEGLRLSSGDAIEGDASVADKIDYFICGAVP